MHHLPAPLCLRQPLMHPPQSSPCLPCATLPSSHCASLMHLPQVLLRHPCRAPSLCCAALPSHFPVHSPWPLPHLHQALFLSLTMAPLHTPTHPLLVFPYYFVHHLRLFPTHQAPVTCLIADCKPSGICTLQKPCHACWHLH